MKNTVFLIDDDKNILTSVSILLETEGFKVKTFSDGESGLKGILENNPDIAVVDIKMPRLNGIELLKKSNPKILIELWKLYVTDKYQKEIEEGNYNFFTNKDYSTDLDEQTKNDNEVMNLQLDIIEPGKERKKIENDILYRLPIQNIGLPKKEDIFS